MPSQVLQELTDQGFIKVRVFGPNDAAQRIAALLKLSAPETNHESINKQRLQAVGPAEWVVCCLRADVPKLTKMLTECLDGLIHLVLDISPGRCAYLLEGDAAQTLRGLSPVDLSEDKFAVGRITRTILGDLSVLISRPAEATFQLVVERSRMESLRALFAHGQS